MDSLIRIFKSYLFVIIILNLSLTINCLQSLKKGNRSYKLKNLNQATSTSRSHMVEDSSFLEHSNTKDDCQTCSEASMWIEQFQVNELCSKYISDLICKGIFQHMKMPKSGTNSYGICSKKDCEKLFNACNGFDGLNKTSFAEMFKSKTRMKPCFKFDLNLENKTSNSKVNFAFKYNSIGKSRNCFPLCSLDTTQDKGNKIVNNKGFQEASLQQNNNLPTNVMLPQTKEKIQSVQTPNQPPISNPAPTQAQPLPEITSTVPNTLPKIPTSPNDLLNSPLKLLVPSSNTITNISSTPAPGTFVGANNLTVKNETVPPNTTTVAVSTNVATVLGLNPNEIQQSAVSSITNILKNYDYIPLALKKELVTKFTAEKLNMTCFNGDKCWPIIMFTFLGLLLEFGAFTYVVADTTSLFSGGFYSSKFWYGGGRIMTFTTIIATIAALLLSYIFSKSIVLSMLYSGGVANFVLGLILLGNKGGLIGFIGGMSLGAGIGLSISWSILSISLGILIGGCVGLFLGFFPIARSLKINQRYLRRNLYSKRSREFTGEANPASGTESNEDTKEGKTKLPPFLKWNEGSETDSKKSESKVAFESKKSSESKLSPKKVSDLKVGSESKAGFDTKSSDSKLGSDLKLDVKKN